MAKLLSIYFPVFQPAPLPLSAPQWVNVYDKNKYWSIRKSLSFNLKKFLYLYYIAKYQCTASTTGFYKTGPIYDASDYCKGIYTVTTSSQFKVNKINIPMYDEEEATIFLQMCGDGGHTWTAEIQQKYRRTNSLNDGGSATNISDRVKKSRNCMQDYAYNEQTGEWVKVSENPDKDFWDYTVTFDSLLDFSLGVLYSFNYYAYLDPDTLTIWPNIEFGGYHNHLVLDGIVNNEDCPSINPKKGTLVFAGKPISSQVNGLGNACDSSSGTIVMNVTWTPSDKLKLI